MDPDRDPLVQAAALRHRLSRLSAASGRINESLDLGAVLQGVLDSARSLAGARHGVLAVRTTVQLEALLASASGGQGLSAPLPGWTIPEHPGSHRERAGCRRGTHRRAEPHAS